MKPRSKGSDLAVLIVVLAGLSIPCARADSTDTVGPPVSQQEFRAWTDWAKKAVDILDRREKQLEQQTSQLSAPGGGIGSGEGGGGGGEVNLSNLSETSTSGSEAPEKSGPTFESYFDLNLINQPGTTNALAFDNYHSLMFVYVNPTPKLSLSFNLLGPSSLPLFWELDYQATSRLTIRAGKIWIPFDDMSPVDPHNMFGGREGITQLMPTSTGNKGQTFLPAIWTELGVGAKYKVVDTQALQLVTHLCITNGFTDGGTDPVNGSTDYPNFTEYTPADGDLGGNSSGNHRDKSIAMRAHALINNTLGIGVSYYTGQWNQDSDAAGHLRLNMIGVDAQLELGYMELRGGIASMNVNLPGSSMRRGGTYLEAGVPFDNSKWKILARGGTLQLDSRIAQPTDMTLIGGEVLYNPGTVQFSLEHSYDVKDPGVAVGFRSYTDLRMILML